MNTEKETDDLNALAGRYRAVSAPPDLAARIRAAAARAPARRRFGWTGPVAAALAIAIGLAITLPLAFKKDAATIPTMTELASAMPDKPALTVPGVGSIRLPQRPPLPIRPERPREDVEPQPQPTEDTGASTRAPLPAKEKNV